MPTTTAELFTLTYQTATTTFVRENLPAASVERMGAAVWRMAGRGLAWDIAVLDADGDDVTEAFDFTTDPAA